MKNYNLISQEKNNFCICSCLQAIFNKHNIKISQEEIAGNLNPSKNGFYVDDDKIKEFLIKNKFEYSYYPYNATPFNEPDILLKEMNENEGFIGINSHIYLLTKFKDPLLNLINPLDNKPLRKNIYNTMNEMQEKYGFFGLLKYIF